MNPASQINRWSRFQIFLLFVFLASFQDAGAASHLLGDLDGDGQVTVLDSVRFVNHLNGSIPLPPELAGFADLNQDGVVNEVDKDILLAGILTQDQPRSVPLNRISSSSPANGETGVSVTRETVIHFVRALAAGTVLNTQRLFAEFGGRKILSRVELSTDRTTATLFYLENLPGSARIRVMFNGNGLVDILGVGIDADGDGTIGGAAVIEFDTLSVAAIASTAVTGRVFASELKTGGSVNLPLEGVRVTVDGMEESLFATTDSQGNFRLEPVPAGRFFVHVDGRTAVGSNWPDGAYYPFVGKAWEAVAGRVDNLAGGDGQIYLPLISEGALTPVSATESTAVVFTDDVLAKNPALAGVTVMVPPNALFNEEGVRGGRVGIAPVAPDRLPQPLPDGLNPSIVITVQTDGAANFDRPVPVRFPNLPDPATGLKLAPGSKSALWSFNHDIGEWEVAGPMTVSEDGNFVVSDPGFGIMQPGWHTSAAGTPATGPKGPAKDPCEGLSTSKIVDNIIDLGVAALKCAADFAGVGDVLKKALSIAAEVKKVVDNVSKLNDLIKKDNRIGVAKAALKTVVSTKKIVVDLVDAFASESPFAKIDKVAKCAESILGALDSICGRSIKGGNGPCSSSVWLQLACIGIGEAKTVLAFINRALEAWKKSAQTEILKYACGAIDAVATQLGIVDQQQHGAAANGLQAQAALSLNDNDPVPAEILAQIEGMTAAVKQLDQSYEVVRIAAGGLLEFPNRLAKLKSSLANFWAEQNGLSAQAYYLIEVAGQKIRGKTDDRGQIRVILPPNASYTLSIYDQTNGRLGVESGTTAPNGFATELPLPLFGLPDDTTDTDGDGLPDVVENVIGSDSLLKDTDGDGIGDGAEINQGTNPLDNRAVQTGLLNRLALPGNALDVCAVNDMALVALQGAGVAVLNIFNGLTPTLIAMVSTPGNATRVACGGGLAAVALGDAGVGVIDLTTPGQAVLLRQIQIGGTVKSVAVQGNTVYAGFAGGLIIAFDMPTGAEIARANVGSSVEDLMLGGDFLYAITQNQFHALNIEDSTITLVKSVLSPIVSTGSQRLFVGGRMAYVVHGKGYNTFDLGVAGNPVLIKAGSTPQFGWRHLVPNGAGLIFAAVNPNSTYDGPNDVSLYDGSDPSKTDVFITTFPTPGAARAVAIYNGLGYVADGDGGLGVINYLAYDNKKVPPGIALNASFSLLPGQAEENKSVRVSAEVTDDVQVRNVEFYIDGTRVAVDGSFPFEFRFRTPSRLDQPSFTVRAKATDTGGNSAWSDTFTVTLAADGTPPRVTFVSPQSGSILGQVSIFAAVFNESIDPVSLNPDSFRIVGAGPDGLFGNADDLVITGGTLSYDDTSRSALLRFSQTLGAGNYRGVISAPLSDLAGNVVSQDFKWSFRIFDRTDADGDGVPDELEAGLGLNPAKADSNGNGVPDGLEDFDRDGLSNAQEIVMGTDPKNPHSIDPNILDGNLDRDGDGLSDSLELRLGTNPFSSDTDGDGWPDEAEVTGGSDPTDPDSRPLLLVRSGPTPLRIGLIDGLGAANNKGLFTARPPLSIGLPAVPAGFVGGLVVGRPTLRVALPSIQPGAIGGMTVGRPGVKIGLPTLGTGPVTGLTVGQPSVKTKFATQ